LTFRRSLSFTAE